MKDWIIRENNHELISQKKQLHQYETIFTIGNGYIGTRGCFEETYANERRVSLVHGLFDDVPVFTTELVNIPDWLDLEVKLAGESFSMGQGQILDYERSLDLHTGLLSRSLRWVSPQGRTTDLAFERFASLADQHCMCQRIKITPVDYSGEIELHAGINGRADTDGINHWQLLDQGSRSNLAWLSIKTKKSGIQLGMSMRLSISSNPSANYEQWDVKGYPTIVARSFGKQGQVCRVEKISTIFTSRDAVEPDISAIKKIESLPENYWQALWNDHKFAWKQEWNDCDIKIEGDDEAQLNVRFGIYQLLTAGPRQDEKVSIGAKTLSGTGYRGHCFWDTEIFMLPFYIYTRPQIARNLLSYRWHTLPGARRKAKHNGYCGAQYAWESATTGDEVTPTWVINPTDSTHLIRIWTGDIEIHVTADVAYAIIQYWKTSGDDDFMLERGAEVLFSTARFWASRVEWVPEDDRFEISNVVGPDEYHDRIDNNAYTNHFARWNLLIAIDVHTKLGEMYPAEAKMLYERLGISNAEVENWRSVAGKIYLPFDKNTGMIEQFDGYFGREDISLQQLEPRSISVQALLGIEGVAKTQVLKQPDVLMLLYLFPDLFDEQIQRINCDYYTARTDHTYGSSLGPAIQAIISCRMGNREDAYEHFIHAAQMDLLDKRGNTVDGIHGATAGGVWQAVVFGFAGLHITPDKWEVKPSLPAHWKRLSFKFSLNGDWQNVDIRNDSQQIVKRPGLINGFIFDLDGVLTDTSEYHYRCWKRLADEEGIPFDRQMNEALRGVPRRESLLQLLNGRPITEKQADEWMERKNRYYQEALEEISQQNVMPGVMELLAELRSHGMRIAIASASKNAPFVVERLGLMEKIDALVDGGQMRRAKPDPDLFLQAASKLGLAVHQCVVVEDAKVGVEAGIAAGMWTIGLGPENRVGNADLVLPSLEGQRLDGMISQLFERSRRRK